MPRVDFKEFDTIVDWFHERSNTHNEWSTENQEHIVKGEKYLLCTLTDNTFRGRVVTFIDNIWRAAGLDPRERELVILAVAIELDSRPIWQQHVHIGLETGLSKTDILALSRSNLAQLENRGQILVRFTTSFVQGSVTDADYDAVEAYLDSETAVGTGLLIASYITFEQILRVFQIEVIEGFIGWKLTGL